MKCCNCGRKYDLEVDSAVVKRIYEDGTEQYINRIELDNRRIPRLCPVCIRAVIYGTVWGVERFWENKVKGMNIHYEDEVIDEEESLSE